MISNNQIYFGILLILIYIFICNSFLLRELFIIKRDLKEHREQTNGRNKTRIRKGNERINSS